MGNQFILGDCMEYLPKYPDNYFDLAIVDPPYGISYDLKASKAGGKRSSGGAAAKTAYTFKGWDNQRPDADYFKELLRVSKSQIVWGGELLCRLTPAE